MNPIRTNHSTISWRVLSLLLITALLAAPSQAPEVPEEVSAQLDILGPPGSQVIRDVMSSPCLTGTLSSPTHIMTTAVRLTPVRYTFMTALRYP